MTTTMLKIKTLLNEDGKPTRHALSYGIVLVATIAAVIIAFMFRTSMHNLEAKDRLHTMVSYILAASDTSIIILDDQGKIYQTNTELLKLTGFGKGELEGSDVTDLIPMRYKQDHDTKYSKRVENVLEQGKHYEKIIECSILCKDGSEKNVIVRIYVTPDKFSLAMISPAENVSIRNIAVDNAAQDLSTRFQNIKSGEVKEYLERQLLITPADLKATLDAKLEVTPKDVLSRVAAIEKLIRALERKVDKLNE